MHHRVPHVMRNDEIVLLNIQNCHAVIKAKSRGVQLETHFVDYLHEEQKREWRDAVSNRIFKILTDGRPAQEVEEIKGGVL